MLLVFVVAVLVAAACAAFAAGTFFERHRPKRVPRPATPQRYSTPPKEDSFTHVAFDPVAAVAAVAAVADASVGALGPTKGADAQALASQPAAWRAEMSTIGGRLRGARVKRIVFVHGTFVGNDTLGVAHALNRTFPKAGGALARAALLFSKRQSDRLLGDNANYVSSYVDLFAEAIGGAIPCASFVWSSENHHVGRVHGAARLARELAQYADPPGIARALARDRVMLIGHSHAGQLFALLTQLIAGGPDTAALLEAAQLRGEDVDALARDLAALRRLPLDIVTFGMPPRYGWGDAPSYRLMNVVNHRGPLARASGLRGLLRTEEGDYVQQLGIAGSDFPATLEPERRLNAKLDPLLGRGTSVRALLRNLRSGLRVPQHGHTFLVDYGDGSARRPNFWSTIFGHGVYTRFGAMLFNARLITDHFYPETRLLPAALSIPWDKLKLRALPPGGC